MTSRLTDASNSFHLPRTSITCASMVDKASMDKSLVEMAYERQSPRPY